MWDVDKSVAYLKLHAQDHSLGQCAKYVRVAIEAGGVLLDRHGSAKDYGPSLEKVRFAVLPKPHISFSAGDVAIIQPIAGHPHGHMCMFDGDIWISDFKQLHGFYPGPSYRKIKPAYKVYRNVVLIVSPPDAVFRSGNPMLA